MTAERVAAIILAAGSAQRFGAAKQFQELGGVRLVDRVAATAASVCVVVVLVLPAGFQAPGDRRGPAVAGAASPAGRWIAVPGGASRAASVRAGLAAVPSFAEILVIADAAHPLAGAALFTAVIAAVAAGADGAVPVLPVNEVLARVEGRHVTGGVDKSGLWLVQTPQAFRAQALRAAHAGNPDTPDDSTLVRGRGYRLEAVEGDPANIHVTTSADLALAERLLHAGG